MARNVAILVLMAFTMPDCASFAARQKFEQLVQHGRENTEAWAAARQRLIAMCAPIAREQCDPRVIKMTNAPCR